MKEYLDSTLLDRAIKFAADAHKDTERRGKGFPYIVHPLEAVSICATISSDQEILAAAALHDVVEDTKYTLEDIKKMFGERVAKLVDNESDLIVEGKSEEESWIERKQYAIDRLAQLDRDSQIVALGDKLSNMRAIARDYNEIGDKLWNRFHVKNPSLHEWHYRGLLSSFANLKDTYAYHEFQFLVNQVFSQVKHESRYNFMDNHCYLSGPVTKETIEKFGKELVLRETYVLDFDMVDNVSLGAYRALYKLYEQGYNILLYKVKRDTALTMHSSGLGAYFTILEEPLQIDMKRTSKIGDGLMSETYQTDYDESSIKLFSNFVPELNILREKIASRAAYKMGLPVPICGDYIRAFGRKGLVFEKVLDKKSFARILADNPSCYKELAKEFYEVGNKFHTTKCSIANMIKANEELIYNINLYNGKCASYKEDMLKFVSSLPSGDTCIHGEFNLSNALKDNNGNVYLIDLPNFAVGHKIYDIAILYSYIYFIKDDAVISTFHYKKEDGIKFFNEYIKYEFEGLSKQEINNELKVIEKLASLSLLVIYNNGRRKEEIDNLLKEHFVDTL